MPIKIPKGFQRRKSSGNALDESQASEPSFKVFSRPESGHKSWESGLSQPQKPAPARKNSFEQEDDDLFTVMRPDATNRGSGGTTTSLSTAPYDSGASSTRLSSSSTIPSSNDARSDRNVHSMTAAHTETQVASSNQPKSNGFLRNAGRNLSFGIKSKSQEDSDAPIPQAPPAKGRFSFSNGRERAMTTSSISTATPPRLLETELSIGSSGLDQFENMFDGIGTRSREQSPIRSSRVENTGASAGSQVRFNTTHTGRSVPQQQQTLSNNAARIDSSPYSWTSDNSRDALINTPSSVNTVVHNSPQLNSGRVFGKAMQNPKYASATEPSVEDNMFAETPSRSRAETWRARPAPQDTNVLPSSIRYTTSSNSTAGKSPALMQTSPILENEDATFDPALLASVQLATRYQEIKPAPAPLSTNKKIMTTAEFERYKQQQEERLRMNKVFKNTRPEDDSDDDYDDVEEDDETEHDRKAAKQRRKQEAHLAVYRQTMIKVTGEGSTLSSGGPANRNVGALSPASQSATDLAHRFSSIGLDKSPARSDDEDDDVPLGILAAHGFPNRNKAPNRLTASSSNPNLRTIMNQQAPPSVAGDSAKRGSLPVFARHLPEDPYYGAGLVNQSNRESLAMNSANLMPSGASTAHPHHPAGLVGVIAGEERARAMRRGSPNAATGTYDLPPSMPMHPEMVRAQTTGSIPNTVMPGMPGMPSMPMLSPGDQAQLQMSQQMAHMMQMQMQWMQQMSQFMAGQGPNAGAPPMMPNQMHPNLAAGVNMPRPQSVPLQSQAGLEQRTMSLLNPPSMLGWNDVSPSYRNSSGSTYAPSIAPSERSNIGLASRYRPVSTVQDPEQSWNKRASTMTSSTFRPFSQFGVGSKQPASTVRKIPTPADDEDDEKGWAEMKAKKDQKKKTWKLRKGQNVLQELYNGT